MQSGHTPRPIAAEGVLVFGGSSGIGPAAARAFAAEGARRITGQAIRITGGISAL
ncbi:MAG: hypothetical protein ACFBSD_06305 [Paracoccaceae bacterium]